MSQKKNNRYLNLTLSTPVLITSQWVWGCFFALEWAVGSPVPVTHLLKLKSLQAS